MARKASGNFNQSQYINGYIKEKYDRINLTVPAGQKAVIEKQAAAAGKSINEYIRDLIRKDLEESKAAK
ncbi:ribbon-helix-helix protein, CopG family [Phascolarctobacterium sp.]|uniref:ribbon-helix-helix protein, CopG family n=1 Tax=Phascolarctobacterium sp. TaxID=2049039 RepID=UPI00386EC4C8